MPTIYEIADELNVNISTVSRALSGKPGVSVQTRARIQELAQARGYQPNLSARCLSTGKTHTMTLLVDDAYSGLNAGSCTIIAGIERVLARHHYSLTLASWKVDPRGRRQFAAGQTDGVIICPHVREDAGTLHTTLASRKLPHVFLDRDVEMGIPMVGLDHVDAGYRATRHLVKQGRARIGFVHLGRATVASPRLRGYRKALRAARQTGPETWTYHLNDAAGEGGDALAAAGEEAAVHLIEAGCNAIVAENDWLAYGVLRAAKRGGLHVPDNLAVVGMDDLPYSSLTDPGLSSLHFDLKSVGECLANTIFEQIAAGQVGTEQTLFQGALVPRAST